MINGIFFYVMVLTSAAFSAPSQFQSVKLIEQNGQMVPIASSPRGE
jgi:hypothetical protein